MSGEDFEDGGEPAARPTRLLAVLLGTAFEGGIGLVAWGTGRAFGFDPLSGFSWSAGDLGLGLVSVLPLLVLFAWCLHSEWPPLARIRRFFDEVVRPLLGGCRWHELALLSLAAGFGEEVLFRGLIQGGLSCWLGPGPALLVASVLFGLAHPITPAYLILASATGAYLGGLWLVSGNLLVVIVAHGAYDFLALTWLLADGGGRDGEGTSSIAG